ncbi:MAG: tetratricopeptide repeat protein [Myxococcota bacterium]
MSPARRALFALVPTLVLFAGAELGLALLGTAPRAAGDDPYVGFAENRPLYVEVEGEDGARRLELAPGKERFFNPAQFARAKGEGVRRVFCVGGSTTYGRPYRDLTSFCGWLRADLEEVAPGGFEVVNAGGISYASYRVANVVRELAGYAPDLVVVYTGHNEFLEERTYGALRDRPAWLRRADLALGRTRVYTALRRLAGGEREQLPGEVSAKLDGSIGPDAYTRDDAWAGAVVEHFGANLERILALVREAGATPLVVVPADNLRDCSPFKSEPDAGLAPAERERFEALLADGVAAYRDERFAQASDALRAASAISPRHAHARYWLGRALVATGELDAATLELVRARDEDVCPLRAISPIVEATREIARRERVATIDYPALLDARNAATGAPARGADWFLDHVHPTIEGHRVLARELLAHVGSLGWLPDGAPGDEAALARAEAGVRARIDDGERGLSLRNLAKVLSWAGKNEDAARAARAALELLGDDAECLFLLSLDASDRGDHLEAVSLLREAVRLDPDWVKPRHNLGVELARAGRDEEALAAYAVVVELEPAHPNVHYNRANALSRLGRLEEAAAAYERALELDPRDADAREALDGIRARLAAD